jgi:anti-anti-sigma factor
VSAHLTLPRSTEALAELFAFTADTWQQDQLPAALRPKAELVLEELFTNVVKYGRGAGPVAIGIRAVDGGVEVTLVEPDAEPFDVTQARSVDVDRPAEQRQPGGLGLHLVRRLVDVLDYRYAEGERRSEITFRLGGAGHAPQPRHERRKTMLVIDAGPEGSVVMTGRLDASQAEAAQAALDRTHGAVTLDCRGLEYISSAGLGVLLKTQKRLMAESGRLRLVGVNRHLQDIFRFSGFDQILDIEPAG